jgi:hypothetical protein
MHVGLLSMFVLLPDFNQNWNVSTNCNNISQWQKSTVLTLVSLPAYFFDPENGGNIFLLNVSTDYTALYPRRWYSSTLGIIGAQQRRCPLLT